MKVYVVVNALSGKVNKPFVVDSEAEAREFCLNMVLSDHTNSLLNLSKFYFCHHLADFDVCEECFHHRCIGSGSSSFYYSEKFGSVPFISSISESESFCVYDVLEPYINQVLAKNNQNEVTDEKDNT